eukprot:1148716-Pelagomonas_calceolata.AAC.3
MECTHAGSSSAPLKGTLWERVLRRALARVLGSYPAPANACIKLRKGQQSLFQSMPNHCPCLGSFTIKG